MDRDSLHDRGRGLEEEYFRKKDRELVEKMRAAAAAEQARTDIGARTGLDAAAAQELQDLGFTPDTVSLLPLVPLVQVAWADQGVTPAERDQIVKVARARGIAEGSAADRQLAGWLASRPGDTVFAQATRLIRAMLDSSSAAAGMSADELVKYCESIAQASGGFFGIQTVDASEKATLKALAEALKAR